MRLFHPWGRLPEGWSGSAVMCRTLSDPIRGQGLMRWVGSHWILSGHVRFPHGPIWVRTSVANQYRSVESSLGARPDLLGQIELRRVSVKTLIWHNGTRRVSMDRSIVSYW